MSNPIYQILDLMEGLTNHQAAELAEQAPACSVREAVTHGKVGRRILIIERDDESMQNLSNALAQAGFEITTVSRGEDALIAIDRDRPHLVMLDWDLPGVVSMNLLRHVRGHELARAPRLIALSTLAGEQQIVAGLELGLDDYVAKPFSVREVIARIRAVLRPSQDASHASDYVEFGELRMGASEGRITVRDRTVSLRATEFRLLEFLMRHPDRAFRREHLLQRVWGDDCRADPRAVDVTVQRIRRALHPHGCDRYVQTVRGIGYRMSESFQSR